MSFSTEERMYESVIVAVPLRQMETNIGGFGEIMCIGDDYLDHIFSTNRKSIIFYIRWLN